MPPTNRLEFIRDFFFTDIMNHLEFLKWTGSLEKDDDILLIHVLESLASDISPMSIQPFYPTSSSSGRKSPLPKNPVHIAKAYSEIQLLSGHDYNIFEFAYLDPTNYRFRAIVAFFIQWGFFMCLLVYNVFDEYIAITPDENGFGLVCLILLMSSILFFAEVRRQRKNALDFNQVMQQLGSYHLSRRIWLHLNYIINAILGILVFFFNIYFILISDDATEAVLNSVALAFIIQIDDSFKPNWDEENQEDALAELLNEYITEDPQSQIDEGKYVKVSITGRQRVFDHNEKNVYVQLHDFKEKEESFRVTVYVADRKDTHLQITLIYEQVDYEITGPRAHELHKAFKGFHCLENYEDILKVTSLHAEEDLEKAVKGEKQPLLQKSS